jgi:Tol biopolymer transport system component
MAQVARRAAPPAAVAAVLASAMLAAASCGDDARRPLPRPFRVLRRLHVGGAAASARPAGPAIVLGTTTERVVAIEVADGRSQTIAHTSRGPLNGPSGAAWTPDGRRFVVASRFVGEPKTTGVVLERFPHGGRTTIADAALHAADAVALSPDGRYLAVAGEERGRASPHADPSRLYAYDLRRHRRIGLLAGPIEAGILSWSPDGRRIAFTVARYEGEDGEVRKCCDSYVGDRFVGGIAVLDVTTGELRELTDEGSDPAFSPDGRHIAFVSRRDGIGRRCGEDGCDVSPEIYSIDPDGAARSRLTRTTAEEGSPAWSPDGRTLVAAAATGDYYDQSVRLVTLRADGSCYRALTPPSDDPVSIVAGAWRPVRGGAPVRC